MIVSAILPTMQWVESGCDFSVAPKSCTKCICNGNFISSMTISSSYPWNLEAHLRHDMPMHIPLNGRNFRKLKHYVRNEMSDENHVKLGQIWPYFIHVCYIIIFIPIPNNVGSVNRPLKKEEDPNWFGKFLWPDLNQMEQQKRHASHIFHSFMYSFSPISFRLHLCGGEVHMLCLTASCEVLPSVLQWCWHSGTLSITLNFVCVCNHLQLTTSNLQTCYHLLLLLLLFLPPWKHWFSCGIPELILDAYG